MLSHDVTLSRTCDRCRQASVSIKSHGEGPGPGLGAIRSKSRGDGWETRRGLDLCPECAESDWFETKAAAEKAVHYAMSPAVSRFREILVGNSSEPPPIRLGAEARGVDRRGWIILFERASGKTWKQVAAAAEAWDSRGRATGKPLSTTRVSQLHVRALRGLALLRVPPMSPRGGRGRFDLDRHGRPMVYLTYDERAAARALIPDVERDVAAAFARVNPSHGFPTDENGPNLTRTETE